MVEIWARPSDAGSFRRGEPVTVTGGAFERALGVARGADANRNQVEVEITVLDAKTSVKVEPWQLKKR